MNIYCLIINYLFLPLNFQMLNNIIDTKKLSISILDLDITNLDQSMNELKNLNIKNIHIDIIDTSFTNNISFGISTINKILKYSSFEFFIHIMIKNPLLIIDKLDLGDKRIKIAVHSHFEDILKINNIISVIAISPNQEIKDLEKIILKFKNALVMTVNPGFGGQELLINCVEKIKKIQDLGLEVTVDGGVNISNIDKVKQADFIVVGSAITKSKDKKTALSSLLNKIF